VAPPISDAVVVDVLRRVDRLVTPLADRLGRPPALPQEERDRWWADKVSRVAAGASALPRFAGKLADLLPLQNALGAAVQSVVVLGVAGEHSVRTPAERVSLLARVLVGREIPPEQVQPLLSPNSGTYREDAFGPKGGGVARRLWRTARLLGRIDETLDARPKGRFGARALAGLPVVGLAGGYFSERTALRKAAARAAQVLAEHRQVTA
jgi:hypothetical protein